MIEFHLDPSSGVATYLQLVQQVHQALRLGLLEPGDRLPTAQQVVASLAINPNTVLKAYRDLEREGLVEGRQGVGTFVLRRPDGPPPHEQAALRRTLATWISRAQGAGLADSDIESMVRSGLRAAADEAIA
jgi:GntR family transcriptional regulator